MLRALLAIVTLHTHAFLRSQKRTMKRRCASASRSCGGIGID